MDVYKTDSAELSNANPESEKLECVVGKIKYFVYGPTATNFAVADLKMKEGRMRVAGLNIPNNPAVTYRLIGTYKQHPKYGRTFYMVSYEPACEKGKDEIVGFLSSGIFKGIGKVIAERIYAQFGEDSVSVLENTPEKLTDVRGISEKKLTEIIRCLKESTYLRDMSKELAPYGISADQCSRLVSKYGFGAAEIVKSNPYICVKALRIPFREADAIAMRMGIAKDSPVRINAGMDHVMGTVYSNGDTGCEVQAFAKKTVAALGNTITVKQVEPVLIDSMKAGKYRTRNSVIKGEKIQSIHTSKMYGMEMGIARFIANAISQTYTAENLDSVIGSVEAKLKFSFDIVQKTAIRNAIENSFSVITGPPGAGKSTIMDVITAYCEQYEKREVVLLASTGRAARKLSEYTNRPAQTIHSYLGIWDCDSTGDEIDMINDVTIIIDEFSMVDTSLAYLLFSHIGNNVRIVIVGDADQLPSVGPGAVLRDILECPGIPSVKLTQVFRAEGDSLIVQNVRKVNSGDTKLLTGKGFYATKETDPEKCREILKRKYLGYSNKYGVDNVMLLLPYRKNLTGTEDMNKFIQAAVNPPDNNKKEVVVGGRILREGDHVMHTTCNTPEASNGDLGKILSITNVAGEGLKVNVLINGKTVVYTRDTVDYLELAYAMTVHKSQGSEAKVVISCITSAHKAMLYRGIPYVAFSRGKEIVDVVYDHGLFDAIKTVKNNERFTLLGDFLRGYGLTTIFSDSREIRYA